MEQDLFTSRLSASENAKFLERLRFTIIASQLLSDRIALTGYIPSSAANGPDKRLLDLDSDGSVYTATGLLGTALAAFCLVWSIHWARPSNSGQVSWWRMILVSSTLLALIALVYVILQRQYTRFVRSLTLEAASSMVTNAQSFDSAASAASTLIQAVEVVSRGYRVSSPLPPASRLDGYQNQTRRCARLRRALRSSLDSLLVPHAEAYVSLQPLVVESDLEQYHEIYDLSRGDVDEAEDLSTGKVDDYGDPESLKSLKIKLHKLHNVRKLYLCSLLAIDANISTAPARAALTETLQALSNKAAAAASSLDKILSEEERFTLPATPKHSSTPSRERVRSQIRKFTALSQGLRGLQAKMQILREESDKALNSSDEVSDLGATLLDEYDAIGSDLKGLIQEWEDGRAALTANIDRNDRRMSQSSAGLLSPRSMTPSSLGHMPLIGGSPSGTLKALNGDQTPILDASMSDEEVFEAIALPRQRNTMTREDRIAKMKEDRVRQATGREKVDVSRHMLKELETVIKLRPRGRTTSGVSAL